MYGNLVGTINGHTVAKDVPSDAKFTDTTYSVVSAGTSTTAGGLMSQSDKTKLNGIAAGAEVNQNAFSNIVVASTTIAADSKTDSFTIAAGSNITILPDATNDKITISATDTTYSVVSAGTSTTAGGLMSQADKTKLNGIATGAEVNQNAFSIIAIGSTTIAADSKTDTLTLVAGSNITLTPDTTNDKVTIAASYAIPSPYCNTPSSTSAKVASCTGYVLRQYNCIQIIMVNDNTFVGPITLNINGTGAKPIYIDGSPSSSSNYTLPAGSYFAYYGGGAYWLNTSRSQPITVYYARTVNMVPSPSNKLFITGTINNSSGYKDLYFNSNWYTENNILNGQNIHLKDSALGPDGQYPIKMETFYEIDSSNSSKYKHWGVLTVSCFSNDNQDLFDLSNNIIIDGSSKSISINDNVILDGDTCDIQLISNSLRNTYSNLSPTHLYLRSPSYTTNISDDSILMREIVNSQEIDRIHIDALSRHIYVYNGCISIDCQELDAEGYTEYINREIGFYDSANNYQTRAILSNENGQYGRLDLEGTEPTVYVRSTGKPAIQLNSQSNGLHGLWSTGYWNGSSLVNNSRWIICRDTNNNNLISGNTYVSGNIIAQNSTVNTVRQIAVEHNGFGGARIDMEVSGSGAPGIYSAKYWNGSSAVTSGVWMMYRDTNGFVRVRSCSGTNSMPIVTTSDADGKRLSGGHCNTSTQLALYGQWGTTGTTYAYRYVAVTTSDPRLKENIEPTKFNALELINKINLYSFDWKNDDTPHYDVGYIATELYELDHNLAIKPEDESEGYWGVNDYYMSGVQTKAIQELSAENNELRNKITSLEARIASLEALIK